MPVATTVPAPTLPGSSDNSFVSQGIMPGARLTGAMAAHQPLRKDGPLFIND
jgi:hypothetical protein